jgi:hypothetical protein
MHDLPFDPEPLLALFMTNENAASFAGDLEERFQRISQRKGWIRATVWFWWELLLSLPPIVEAAGKPLPDTTTAGLSNPLLPFAARSTQDLYREMHVVGHQFEMRSDQDLEVGEEFSWSGLTLRVTTQRPDDGHFLPNWPWRFMYGFEVVSTEETEGIPCKTF